MSLENSVEEIYESDASKGSKFKSFLKKTATGLMLLPFVIGSTACSSNNAGKVNTPNVSHPDKTVSENKEESNEPTYVDLGFRSDDKVFFDRMKGIFHTFDYTFHDKSIDDILSDPNVGHEFVFDLCTTQLALRTIISLRDESVLPENIKFSPSNTIQFDKYIRLIGKVIESTPWSGLLVYNPELVSDEAFYISTEYLRDYSTEESYWDTVKKHIGRLRIYAPVVGQGGFLNYKPITSLNDKEEISAYKGKIDKLLDYFEELVSKSCSGQEDPLLKEIVYNPETLLKIATPFFGMDEKHLLSFFDWYQNPKKRVSLSINYTNYPSDPFTRFKGKYDEISASFRIFANKEEKIGLVLRDYYDAFIFYKSILKGDNVDETREEMIYCINYSFNSGEQYNLTILDTNHNLRFDKDDKYNYASEREYKPITGQEFKSFIIEKTEYETLDDFLNALNDFLDNKVF